MADEKPEIEETEAQPEAPSSEAPSSTSASEQGASDSAATDSPASDSTANDASSEVAAEPVAKAEPVVQLKPKERRAAKRGAKAAKVGVKPTRTGEERHAERQAERTKKAKARTARRGQEREKYKAQSHETEPTAPREHVSGVKKTRQGVVVSDKAQKTITVRIDVARRHRRYQKVVRTSSTVHAHDEHGEAHVGDTVVVVESRPLSATKRWRLVEVVERAR